MNVLLTTVAAIVIFAVMIFIHELGHFIAAKLTGVRVNEFALGMGPKLISRKKGDTVYSLRLIPIGGFCAMEGEDEDTGSEDCFSRKKPYIRLLILVAGAFMNILLGFVLTLAMLIPQESFVAPKVERVVPGGAAEASGLQANDTILRANGRRVHVMDDLSWEISNNTEENFSLTLAVKNNGEKREVTILPGEVDGEVSYGIILKTEDNNILKSFRNAFFKTGFYSRVIVDSFVNMLQGKVSFSEMSGPIGIVSEIGTAVEETRSHGWEGFQNLMFLTILLTINLGVFNLLPLPALDGGRILFVLIEMIRRKPVPVEKEAIVHFIGFAILIAFSIFIAFKDVLRIWG